MDIDTLLTAFCAVSCVVCWVVCRFFDNDVYLTYKEQVIPQKNIKKKGAKR